MVDVLLVGGGTAGHVLPAIATAQALERRRRGITIAFAGLADSLEERLVQSTGHEFHTIDGVPLPRRPSVDLLRVAPRLLESVRRARRLLETSEARTVVSFGGYVALPVALAARGRVPLVLHEQNSRPGLANRIAARFADRIAVTFPSSAERLGSPDRVRITGNPVQQRLRDLDVTGRRAAARTRFELDRTRPTLLVLGGSQGARSINRAVSAANDAWGALGLQVIHITGPRGFEESVEWWRASGIEPEADGSAVRVVPFLDDMADAYAAADVVVSRAGATTIAEVTLLGIPAVLVPYPHATAQHQQGNAEAVERAGAAFVLDDADLSPDSIATSVAAVVGDPQRAGAMASAARAWSRPEADEALARIVLDLLGDSDA